MEPDPSLCTSRFAVTPPERRESPFPRDSAEHGHVGATCQGVCLLLHLPQGRSPACVPGCPCNTEATTCFLLCYLTHELYKHVNETAAQPAKMTVSAIAVLAKGNGEEKGASHPSFCAFEHKSKPKGGIKECSGKVIASLLLTALPLLPFISSSEMQTI